MALAEIAKTVASHLLGEDGASMADQLAKGLVDQYQLEFEAGDFRQMGETELAILYYRLVLHLSYQETGQRVTGRRFGQPISVNVTRNYYYKAMKQAIENLYAEGQESQARVLQHLLTSNPSEK